MPTDSFLAHWYKQTLEKFGEVIYPRENTFVKGFVEFEFSNSWENEILRDVDCLPEPFLGKQYNKTVRRDSRATLSGFKY